MKLGKKDLPSDEERGVYRKFKVARTDGSHKKGGKHENCSYYVLDLEHDEFAVPALKAYAKACKKKYPELARDLIDIVNTRQPDCGCREAGCPHTIIFGPSTPSEALAHKINLSEEP